jgi:uncharacterized protein (TIGR02145 family)
MKILNTLLLLIVFACFAGCKKDVEAVQKDVLTVTDIDGNVYNTVTIGTQVWMASNLKTTKYMDGIAIPLVTDGTAWSNLSTPGYCWNKNDASTNKSTYGALYNGYTVNTGKLCPTGWHVPSDAEWTVLTTYLGGEAVAGGKLKETGTSHWYTPNEGATNSSGFAALPGGYRSGYRSDNGTFFSTGYDGGWWSSSVNGASYAWYRFVICYTANILRDNEIKQAGFSVRCVKD